MSCPSKRTCMHPQLGLSPTVCLVALHLTSCDDVPQDIKFNVHAHPTLSEVLDELFKQAHVDAPTKRPDPKPASMERLPVAV